MVRLGCVLRTPFPWCLCPLQTNFCIVSDAQVCPLLLSLHSILVTCVCPPCHFSADLLPCLFYAFGFGPSLFSALQDSIPFSFPAV